MTSTFLSLLRHARSAEIEATENFTTEALAACIRSDAMPFLALLERASVIATSSEVTEIVALTQVAYAGAGVIDMVLQIGLPARALEVWVEVKVDASESGNQLDNYRRYIETRVLEARPELVTLSRWPLRTDPELLWLSWQAVRQQALTSAQPYWIDFAKYLEEIRMADEFDAPITSREAASLADAARLLGKTRRILWPVFESATTRWPDAKWPGSEEEVRRNLAVWYRDRGRYTAQLGDYGRRSVWLDIGVWPGSDESELGISVVTEPKILEVRTTLLAAAEAADLPTSWERHIGGWEALKIRERLVSFRNHESGRDWLLERLAELAAAGILALVGTSINDGDVASTATSGSDLAS